MEAQENKDIVEEVKRILVRSKGSKVKTKEVKSPKGLFTSKQIITLFLKPSF